MLESHAVNRRAEQSMEAVVNVCASWMSATFDPCAMVPPEMPEFYTQPDENVLQ